MTRTEFLIHAILFFAFGFCMHVALALRAGGM